MRPWPAGLFAGLLLALAPAAFAAPDRTPADTASGDAAAFHGMVALDTRMQSVGWRLARANARWCPKLAPSVGLLVQDLQSWHEPDAARAAFAVGPETQVVVGAVAAGSPAAEAGLHPGQPLRTIADTVLAIDLPPAAPGTYARQIALLDLLEDSLRRNSWVAVGIDTAKAGRFVRLSAEKVCASRFEIASGGNRAQADGNRVVVSDRIAAELADDDQFAFVVAHELAHNVLGHVAWLKQQGRGWGRVRRTEREADRLAVWLMANAGYDTGGAARFMRGWARQHDVGFLDPTHDAWDERLAGVEAEIALIAASGARSAGYDWAARFPMRGGDAKSAR